MTRVSKAESLPLDLDSTATQINQELKLQIGRNFGSIDFRYARPLMEKLAGSPTVLATHSGADYW